MPSRRRAWRRRRATGGAAPYYRWLFFAAGPLEAAATNKALGFEVPAERKAMVGYGSLDDVIDALEAALSDRDTWSATASPRPTSMSARRSAGG